jgi:CHASE1-domain containing sensor protein
MGTDSARSTLRPFVGVGLAVTLGLALTAALGLSEWGRHRADLEAKFKQEAINRLNALQSAVQIHVALFDAVRGLYAAGKVVGREEFNAFVREQRIERHGIEALEWAPRVGAAEREAFEEAARHGGPTDFRIWESGPDGRPVAASSREEYFPVYYVEPLAGNEAASGFDFGSDPTRGTALERARDTGMPAASEPISLVREPGELGVLLFVPTYRKDVARDTVTQRREGLAGFALALQSGDVKLTTILIVDDQDAVQMVLRVALEQAGFHIQEARNGAEAILMYRENPALQCG